MEKQQFDLALQQLHHELQQIESVDETERQLLRQLMADIRKLTRSENSDQLRAPEGLVEELTEGMERFEASHPQATLLMGQVIDALAKMGI